MRDLWTRIFGGDPFMPHGHCFLWEPTLVWLQAGSNAAIGLAYFSITFTLVHLVRKIRDLPFQWVYVAFAFFTVACGLTHLSDVLVIWRPAYWLDSGIRTATAVASVGAAILLPSLVPKAVALAESASLSRSRGRELERVNRELCELLERARQLEQLKTDFFANVSHELRTPLALILGPAERLLASEADPGRRRELAVVHRNARALLRHVNDLLDAAKLDSGKLRPSFGRLDLAALTRLVASQFEGVAAERSIRFDVRAPDSLLAEVDRDKLERVLLNLLANAFKFTPTGGAVRCELRVDGPYAALEVGDSGPGIPLADREAVFERFHQLERPGARHAGGTGLGLAIVREFVLLHAGEVEVADAPEGGALLRVRVPVRAPAGVEVPPESIPIEDPRPPAEEPPPADPPPPVDPARDRPRVLVVEDNDDMRRYLVDCLADDYAVTAAADGREALALAEAGSHDLVLTDIMMPNMGGEALVRLLRARPATASVPIVLLSARADDVLRARLLREGAQDYVIKPFSLDELRARIANLVTVKRARDHLQGELDTRDVDLERLAAEVAQRNRELVTAVDSLSETRAQAESASRAKSRFLGLVSHELRAPLTAIQLQLELLRRERSSPGGPRADDIVTRLGTATTRLVDLVDGLLQYTQLQSQRVDVDAAELDLDALVADIAAALGPVAEQKQLALVVRRVGPPAPMRSDRRLVRLIVANLVGNALKFTRAGAIEVELRSAAGEHVITVKDTGPGIAAADRVRIFQPFEQLEPVAQKHTAGIGLGLTLVREMALALGGSITLDSELGVGSSFTVHLPDRDAAA